MPTPNKRKLVLSLLRFSFWVYKNRFRYFYKTADKANQRLLNRLAAILVLRY